MVQSQAIQSLTIARLAAAGGVGVETIRFYQRKGLLQTPTREMIKQLVSCVPAGLRC
jgi:MerR family transcriptional regulator, mercuric resistance operon regulatory protein